MRPPRGEISWRHRARTLALTHWPLLLATLVAVAFRSWKLFPTFFYGDDAEYATVAAYLAGDPLYLGYPQLEGFGQAPFVSQPPLILYLFAAGAKLTGSLEVGPVLVSFILGIGTVICTYFIALMVSGRAAGGFAALTVAVLPLHISLSRKAFLDVGFTFFFTLAILLFILWTRHRTTGLALGTGTAAAATTMSKLPGVLIFPILVTGILVVAWPLVRQYRRADDGSEKRLEASDRLRRVRRHTLWAVIPPAALGTLYLLHLAWLRALGNLAEKLLWNAGRVSSGEGSGTAGPAWHWYVTDPDTGLVSQFGILLTVAAVAGGVIVSMRLRRASMARRAAYAVLLAWPVLVLAFFTLSARKQWFYILPAAPGAAVLAGIALAAGYRTLRAFLASRTAPNALRAPRWAVVASVAILIVPTATPAAWGIQDVATKDKQYGRGVKDAALLIQERDPEAVQIGTILGRFTLHFYNGQTTYHYFVDHQFVNRSIESGQVRYVVIDDYLNHTAEEEWLHGLVATYDGSKIAEYESKPGKVRVWVYALNP